MKNKTTIEIDLEVFKLIVQHSNYINEPPNDVLKRLLKIEAPPSIKKNDTVGGLITKGIFLRNGLQLRKNLKGTLLEAIVKNGYIEFNKKKYTSPSGAAVDAAKSSVNGWTFWDYLDESTGKWKSLITLRDQ